MTPDDLELIFDPSVARAIVYAHQEYYPKWQLGAVVNELMVMAIDIKKYRAKAKETRMDEKRFRTALQKDPAIAFLPSRRGEFIKLCLDCGVSIPAELRDTPEAKEAEQQANREAAAEAAA